MRLFTNFSKRMSEKDDNFSGKGSTRRSGGWTTFESIKHDVRFAVRMLLKSPGFTIVSLLCLAIGIGGSTAVFSEVNAVLLRMLPVKDPQALRQLEWTSTKEDFANSILGSGGRTNAAGNVRVGFSYPAYATLRDRMTRASDVLCFSQSLGSLGLSGRSELISIQLVSGNYFQALGLSSAVGRSLVPDDDRLAAAPAIVISWGFWQRVFGGDFGALNRTVTINSRPATIVGITPEGFFGLDPMNAADVFVPITLQELIPTRAGMLQNHRIWTTCRVVARPKPGVSDREVEVEAEGIVAQVIQENPPNRPYEPPRLWVSPAGQGLDSLRRSTSLSLITELVVVGVILLITCANIASLLLARATARQREVSTRMALGAPRKRLIQQLLTESVLLSVTGGAIGVVLAYLLNRFIPSPIPQVSINSVPLGVDVMPDLRVWGFALVLMVVTGIVFGVWPAFQTVRGSLVSRMKLDSSGASSARFRFMSGKVLVAAQVAFTLLILIGAGLFVRTITKLRSVPLGFDPNGLLVFKVNPALNGYREVPLMTFFENAVTRMATVPGVVSASVSSNGPLDGSLQLSRVCIPGYQAKSSSDMDVALQAVSPRFFETWKIPLLQGRDFQWTDRANAPMVAVIDETFAKKYYSGKNPVGETVDFSCVPSNPLWATVVGVVANSRYNGVREEGRPTIYRPFRQRIARTMTFAVRASGDPIAKLASARQIIAELDANLPIYDAMTQVGQIDRTLGQERVLSRLFIFFGIIALVLSCTGIYGMLAYLVDRSTREIGLRMALGASTSNVLSMVMKEMLLPLGAGIAAGLVAAFGASRWIEAMLFGVSSHDVPTILASAFLFLVVAAFGAAIPARRASRIAPQIALRNE